MESMEIRSWRAVSESERGRALFISFSGRFMVGDHGVKGVTVKFSLFWHDFVQPHIKRPASARRPQHRVRPSPA
jgi:hypothetical protein